MIRLESDGGGVELRVTRSREDIGHGIEGPASAGASLFFNRQVKENHK